MNLGKSDKIIAVVGVLIIVIAAIGICFYTAPEEEMLPIEPEVKEFYVTWSNMTDEMKEKGDAGKKSDYTKTIPVTVPAGSVLTNVEFELSWKDDDVYGLKKDKGLDKLEIEIKQVDGESKKASSTGSGTKILGFTVNDVPIDDYVDAEDILEAEEIVDATFSGKNEVSFNVKVTITPGEKIIRPLKFLKDKGDDFQLKVTYEYYVYNVEEPE